MRTEWRKQWLPHVAISAIVAALVVLWLSPRPQRARWRYASARVTGDLERYRHTIVRGGDGSLESYDLHSLKTHLERLITECESKAISAANTAEANAVRRAKDHADQASTQARDHAVNILRPEIAKCVKKDTNVEIFLRHHNRRLVGGGDDQVKHANGNHGQDWHTFFIR